MKAKTLVPWSGRRVLLVEMTMPDKLSPAAYCPRCTSNRALRDDHQLRRLDRRKSTMMAGASTRTPSMGFPYSPAGTCWITATVLFGIWPAGYRYTNGGLTFNARNKVEWNSENQNDYYYGVSRKESSRSGSRGYNPNDSWNPVSELSANHNFAGNWSVYGTVLHPSVG
ncbi:MipA/OmpV family protein [Salmonella enterica subsp. enterica serovar Weltevreden]|nr:MipA/OmpV family protein [Salmonella enterica subsp. enterica serovar Weltevreden]